MRTSLLFIRQWIGSLPLQWATLLVLFIVMGHSSRAQTYPEQEPNNTVTEALGPFPDDPAQQRIFQPGTITGQVSSGDDDYWLIGYDFSLNFGGDDRWWLYFDGNIPAGLTVERGQIEVPTGLYAGTESSTLNPPFTHCGTFEYTSSFAGLYTYLKVSSTDGVTRNYSITIKERDAVVGVCFGATEPREEVVVPCTAPVASSLSVTRTGATTLRLNNFPAVADADGYIVEISDGSFGNFIGSNGLGVYDDPILGNTPNSIYSGSGAQIVAHLTSPGVVDVTGLTVGPTYTFKVTPYNHCLSMYRMGTPATITSVTCGAGVPEPTSLTVSSSTPGTLTLESIGEAAGTLGYVTYMSDSPTGFTTPIAIPSANPVYSGSGTQAIHVGTTLSPNLSITGSISEGTTYYFRTYAYENCAGSNFFSSTGFSTSKTICDRPGTPTVLSITGISHSSMNVASISPVANADGYVVLMNTANSFTTPTDGASLPTADAVYGGSGEQVVYAGTASTANTAITGLDNTNGGVTYYFKAFAFQSCEGTNYFEPTGIATSATTRGAAQTVASNATFFEVGDSFMDFKSFNGAVGATGHVIKMNTSNSFTVPADGSASLPTASASYTGGEQAIYAGTSTAPDFRITGLTAATTYHFAIYTYSNIDGQLFYNQTAYEFSQQNVKPTPGITFSDITRTYGDAAFVSGASTNSSGALTYSLVSQTNGGSAVAGNGAVTVGNVGTVTIQVDQAADANFNPGTAQATLTINKADPIIQFDPVVVSFGASDQSLTASAQVVGSATGASTGTISYNIEGASPAGNALSGSNNATWTPGDAGTFTMRASITEDANHNVGFKDALFAVSAPSETFFMSQTGLFLNTIGSVSTLSSFGGVFGTQGIGFKLINDKIWATTQEGGANSQGVLFNVNKDGTSPTVLQDIPTSFNANAIPLAPFEAGGKVWVLAINGGSVGVGEIYSLDPDGTNFQTVHTFDGSDFAFPGVDLVEFNGKLYGAASSITFVGGIYSLTPNGSGGYTYAVEHTFTGTDLKRDPYLGFTIHNNLLWYTSYHDRLVAYDPATNTFPHDIDIGGIGSNPIEINNKLYVATSSHIKEVNASYTGTTNIHTFSGISNLGYLTFDGDNILGIGTESATSTGQIYSIKPDGTNFTITHTNSTVGQAFTDRAVKFVEKLDPTITFPDQTVGHLSVTTLNATANSTNPVTYALIGDATASGLSGNQFTAGNIGTVTIRASVAEDINFNAATHDATFTIAKVDPAFTISDLTLPFGSPEQTLTPDATNYSGGLVTYQFVDGGSLNAIGPNTGSTILTGNKLTVSNPGFETIRANIPATSNFNTATVDFQLTVNDAVADLSGFTNITANFFQDDITLSIPTAAGVAVTYQMLTSNTGSRLSGANNAVLSIGNVAGTETIRVSVIEANYQSTTKDITLTVNKGLPAIVWDTPADIQFGIEALDASRLNASASVAGGFTYWIGEADFGTQITPGTTTMGLGANQQLTAQFFPTDTDNYQETTFSVTINATKINLEFTADDKVWVLGQTEPALTYTVTSGEVISTHFLFLPITRGTDNSLGTYPIEIDLTQTAPYQDPFGDGDSPICAPGLCIVNGNATSVIQTVFYNITFVPGTFTITDKPQITASDITFIPPASLTYDNTLKAYNFSVATLDPVLPVGDIDLTYEGRNGTVYASNTTAPTNAGDYTVIATVNASNLDYGGSVSSDFTITPASTTINLTLPPSNFVYNATPQGVTAPTADDINSNPTLTLVTEYGLSGGTIFSETVPTDAGTYVVRVNLAASETNYMAPQASGTIVITQRSQSITFNPIPEVGCGQTTIDLTNYASSSTGSTIAFASDNPSVVSVLGNTATILGAGSATITASQAGDANNAAAVDQTQTLTISAVQENFTVDNPADVQVCNGGPYALPALTTGNYFSEPGGTGTAYNAGDNISSTTTLYVYGVSAVNATCTDENSFTVTIDALPVDNLSDVTAVGSYILPILVNGNYFTGPGGTGIVLGAGSPITTSQTIYIYNEDLALGCSAESSFMVNIELAPALHFEQVVNFTDYDYLSVPDDNSLDFTTHFTYEAWVNFDQLSVGNAGFGWRSFFHKSRYTDSYGLMVYAPTKLMRFYHAGVGAGFTDYSWSSLSAGAWHHVAVKWDDTNSKTSILIDGVEVSSNTSVTGSLAVNTLPLLIGASDDRASDPYPFDGVMDEVRFWNIARTDAEINSTKDVELAGTESGLVLYYNFSEGTIDGDNTGLTQVTDQSSAGNHASFNSFALSGIESNFVDGSGNGVVPGLPQNITFNPLSNVTFGDADITLTGSSSSGLALTYSSSNTSVATVSGNTMTIVGVGTTTITASQSGDATFLPASNVTQTLTVDPFSTSIVLNLPGTNPAYLGMEQGVSPTANDVNSSPSLALLTEYSVQGANSFSVIAPTNAGNYDVRVNLAGSETNYTASQVIGSFTIDKVPLTATLNNVSIVYGEAGANNHATTFTGFVNGETPSVLSIASGWPQVSYLNGSSYYGVGGSYVGGVTWATDPQLSITSANYAITFDAGDINSVTPRPINVTANNRTVTYGADANSGNTVVFQTNNEGDNSGLASGETSADFSGTLSFANITQTNVGNYTGVISPSGLINANYNITYLVGDLDIVERDLTIQADNRTILYGDDPNMGNTVTYTGFATGEDESLLTGTLTFSNISFSAVGSYSQAISPNGLSNSNYNILFEAGDLTIDPRPLTVTADNRTITYGSDANTGNSVTYSGFAAGETAADLSGTLTFANITQTDAGTYTGVITPSGLNATNYAVSFVNGNLTIDPLAITVTADAQSKAVGEADPAFTYSVTVGALVGMDAFSGSLTRVAGESVGTYAITQGSLTAGTNYALTYIADDLTINAASQSITFATLADVMFGDADFSLGATASSGLAVSYASSDPTVATVSGNTVTIVGVGTTNITASQAGDANYDAALDVVQPLTVTHGIYERYFVKVNEIYGMTAANVPVLVKTLSSAEGQNIEDLKKVGNQIWGTTTSGGATSTGTLFRMDPDGGNFEVIHDFTVAEGNPRNDMAVVADTEVYGVAGDYGIFKVSATNTAADPTFYNGYSGANKFLTGLTYHQDKLWVSDNGTTIVGINTDFSGHEIASQIGANGNPVTDFIVEGYRMVENLEQLNIAYFPQYTNTHVPSQDWTWNGANEDVALLLTVPVEDKHQTKIIFADGQYFNPLKTGGQFSVEVIEEDVYNSILGFSSVNRAVIPALNGAIGATSLASLSKPYFNLYDVKDSVIWGIRGDAATGLYEAFSHDLKTGAYQAHDFGSGNLNAGVPNAGFLNFRKTATLVTQDQTKAYGDPVPSLNYEIWGLDAGDDASNVGGITTSAELIYGANLQPTRLLTSTSHPGIYSIKAVADTANGKYDLRHLFGSLTVTYAVQQSDIIFSPATATYTYDGTAKAFTAVGKADTPAGTSGIFRDVSGNSLAATDFDYTYAASIDGGMTYTVDLGTTAPVNAGMYRATATVKSTNTVYSGSATFDFEIETIGILINPNTVSKVYDGMGTATDPEIGFTSFPALIGSDTFTGALSREAGSDAGDYAINLGTLSAGSNYVLGPFPQGYGDFTITPLDVTITPDPNQSKVYDGTDVAGDPTITYTHTPLLGSDTFTGELTRAAGTDANTYAIEMGTLSAGGNYNLSVATETFDVTALAITVTPDANQSKAFDGMGTATDPILTYAHSPALIGSDVFTGALTRVDGSDVNTYAIEQGTLALSSNYALSLAIETFEINALAVTVTPDANQSRAYDALGVSSDPTIAYQVSPALTGSDTFTGALTRAAGSDAGLYAIEIGSLVSTGNYAVTLAPETFEIVARELFILPDPVSKIYDGMGTTTDPEISYFPLGIPRDATNTMFTGALSRTEGSDVGAYPINLGNLSAGSNYVLSLFTGGNRNLTITPLDVTITPDPNQNKVYDGGDTATDPILTYTGNLLGSDTFTGALTRAAGTDVNSYAIELGTLDAGSNYNVSVAAESFEISPLAITVTPDAAQSKVYDAMGISTDPVLTYTHAPDLIGSDVFTGALTRAAGSDVNTYTIEQGTLELSSNYTLSLATETFEITQRNTFVTVHNQTKIYGNADPVLTYALAPGSSLVGGDDFTGALARDPGEDVDMYLITEGTLTAGSNYNLLLGPPANLTITALDLAITADEKTKTLGGTDPALTYTITSGSLVGSDMLTGALTRIAGETVGDYAIQQGTLASGSNYNISFTDGKLTITDKIPQTITFGALSAVTYGDATFDLTATGGASGNPVTYVSSDLSVATVSGSTVTIVGAGTTTITASQVGDATYADASDVNQVLMVNQRDLMVTANANQSKVYGDTDPTFNYTITSGSLVGMDAFTGSLDRVAGENVGTYAIGQSTLANANYNITYVSSDFSITTRAITVTADVTQVKIYGDADPDFTYQITSGALQGSDVLSGALSRDVGENTGFYPITQGTLANVNYNITFVSNNFLIAGRSITVTVDAGQNKVYGEADPVLTYQITSGSLLESDMFSGALSRTAGEDVGTYAIGFGTLSAGSNYNVSFITDDLSITAKPLTITADANQRKTYGESDPAITYTITTGSLVGMDALTGTPERVTGENAGTYAINQGTLDAGSNYTLTFISDDFTIDPITLEISADDKTKIEATADPDLTYTMTSGALINGDMLSGNLARVAGEGLGNYAIQQATLTAGGNYNINFTEGTLTITDKLLQSITFNTLTDVTYGDAAFMLSATGGASGNPVTFSGDNPAVATVTSTGDVTIVGVGTVNITANQAGDATYAAADPVVRTLTINPAALTVTAVDKSSTYGDASLPALTVAYSGFVIGETESVLTSAPVLNTTATTSSNAGTYPITVSGAVAANYTITHVDGTMTIDPATLTLTADDQSSTYGEAIPGLTVTYAGFVNGEDESVLTSSPSVATTATNTSDAGTYAITANGATADNYTITEVNGTLTIGQAILSVTADDQSKSYGGANPSFTLSYSGFIGSDDESVLDTAPIGSTSATSSSSAGTYAITASGGIDNNYTFSYTDGTLTVNQTTLSVTAEDQSKTYGASNPGLTLTYAGFQNGDDETSLTTAPTASTTADETSSVGTYAITASGGVADNYTFSYTDGTLTVNQATLTVTANDQTITYGDDIPALTFAYAGFQNGDDDTVLDTAPTASTNATTTSDAGAYSITVSGGADNNYDFTYTEGTLTINQADQTINFDALAEKTVGDADFDLTATTTSGLAITYTSSDESVATISGSIVTILSAGTTTITASQGGGTNFNAATSVEQTLTVNTNIQDQTISFEALDNQSYGASPIELAGSASSGLTVSYTSSDESVATVSGNTVTIHGVGATNITASQSGNDSFTAAADVTQTLTIDPAMLSIVADDRIKGYGDANPAFTVTYSGFVNGEDATIVDATPTVSTTATASSDAGDHEILVEGGSSENYTITRTNGNLTITKINLTIMADDQVMTVGSAVPTLTTTITGFVNSDTEAELDVLPAISTEATSASPSGVYEITLTGGEDNNYEYTLINGMLTIETVLGLVLEQSQIMIYPNPVADKLIIDFPQSLAGEEIKVQLFDLEGRQLQSKAVEGYGIELDVRDLPSGILILQMSVNGEVIRKRVKKD